MIEKLIKIRNYFVLPYLFVLFISAPLHAKWQDAELNWHLKRDRNGIQVYLSKVPDSKFRALMSVMELKATPKQLAALVMDLDNCPNWADMCKSAKVVEKISLSETVVYSVNDAPFPVRDRDVVSIVKWSHDQATGEIFMNSEAVP